MKKALLLLAIFLVLLAGICAVLAGLTGTACLVAGLLTRTECWDTGYAVGSLTLLAGGIAVLDFLVNRWPAGKATLGGRRRRS